MLVLEYIVLHTSHRLLVSSVCGIMHLSREILGVFTGLEIHVFVDQVHVTLKGCSVSEFEPFVY